MKGRSLKFAALASLLAGLLALPSLSRADYVQAQTPWSNGVPESCLLPGHSGGLFDRPNVVRGTSLVLDSLSLAGAGSLSIRLSDLNFPQPLEQLSLLVTDLRGIWERLDGSGSLLVDLSGPAKLFVAVFAQTSDHRTPGLYAVSADFTPVPLPGAVWLLLSGLGGLVALRRKLR